MIDQRLAGMPVVDEQPVEALLLEDRRGRGCWPGRRSVAGRRPMRGGRERSPRDRPRGGGRAWPARSSRRGGRPARRCGRPCAGRTKAIRRSFSRRTSWRASRLKSADLERDARAGLALGVVERVVGGDQAAVDRVAQVRQIEAAERAVPVGAVALAAIELLAGDLEVVGVGVAGRLERRPAARETPSIRAYISSLSAYFALKFRQKPPARKNGSSSSAAGDRARAVAYGLLVSAERRRAAAPTRSSRGTSSRAGRPCPAAASRRRPGRTSSVSSQSRLADDHVAEPAEPAVRVDVIVRLGPGAELLAVVGEDDGRARAARSASRRRNS